MLVEIEVMLLEVQVIHDLGLRRNAFAQQAQICVLESENACIRGALVRFRCAIGMF
jgi:hypothetical protein